MLLRWLSLQKKARCRAGSPHRPHRSQYTALSFGKRLEEAGIVPSMGRAGSALENAISESFVASLKCELLHRHRFLSREAARTAVYRLHRRVLQPGEAALVVRLLEPL
jgi:transposase InsO family protein